MKRRSAALSILLVQVSAHADIETDRIDVVGDPDQRALEDPAFVTVINADERRGETLTTAEALAETVGATVRSLGGLGSFSSVSLRGAPSGETQILVDGIPVSRIASSSFDLGTIDLRDFGEVDVYRGGAPIDLGGAALGGAVNFVTRLGSGPNGPITLEVGTGSWAARDARVTWGRDLPGGGIKVGFGYSGAADDFAFFDDNGTPLARGDDFTGKRRNNGWDQVDLFERARIRFDKTTIEAGARATVRSQGVPGPSGASATDTSLQTVRLAGDFGFHRSLGSKLALGSRLWVAGDSLTWEDPKGEISLAPTSSHSTAISTGLTASLAWTLSAHQVLRGELEGTFESFREAPLDPKLGGTSAAGTRGGGAISVDDEIVLGKADAVVLQPAVRFNLLATRGQGVTSPATGPTAPGSRDDVYVSPRLAARWKVTTMFTLKGNVGRYFRPPTVLELFGDQGFVVGNPTLLPEEGTTGDLGFVLAPPGKLGPFEKLSLEYAFFVARPHDLIVMLPTSGRTIRARNLGDADLAGHEVSLAVQIVRWLRVSANYTFTGTEQRSPLLSENGKALPGRPLHEVTLRVEGGHDIDHRPLSGWVEATIASGNYLDVGNVEPVPARELLGAGVKYEVFEGLLLALEAKNLLGQRVQDVTVPGSSTSIPRAVTDVLGFPLPGRSLYVTASYSF